MFYDILGERLLGKEAREGAVLVGGPFEVGAQESVDGAHEFDLEFGSKKTFEPLLYVDDFVYFSKDAATEQRFERLLAAKLKVKFMGTVNWFLGTHFEWSSL